MNEHMEEFITFMTTARDGSEVEMAVVDEFDFENHHYAVTAQVVDDAISQEGRYIFKCNMKDDDVTFEKIRNAIDYQKIAEAYMELEEE